MTLDRIQEEVNNLINRIGFCEEEQKRYRQALTTLGATQDKLIAAVEKNSKADVVLTYLFDRLNERGLGVLDSLIEEGLGIIFPDRQYSVRHVVKEERGSNQLSFYVLEKRADGLEVVSNMRNATGGGVRAVAGLICTYYYLLKMNAERFIVLDEGLSQVSDARVDALFDLIKSFGRDSGFKILLITHDVRFRPYFDREYQVTKEGYLKELGGKGEDNLS